MLNANMIFNLWCLCITFVAVPGALLCGELILRIPVVNRIVEGLVRDIRAGRSIFR